MRTPPDFGSELFWIGEDVEQAPDPAYQGNDLDPRAVTSNVRLNGSHLQEEIGTSPLPDPEQQTGAQSVIAVLGPSPPPIASGRQMVNQGRPRARYMDVTRQLEMSQTGKMGACIRCRLQRIRVSTPINPERYLC